MDNPDHAASPFMQPARVDRRFYADDKELQSIRIYVLHGHCRRDPGTGDTRYWHLWFPSFCLLPILPLTRTDYHFCHLHDRGRRFPPDVEIDPARGDLDERLCPDRLFH